MQDRTRIYKSGISGVLKFFSAALFFAAMSLSGCDIPTSVETAESGSLRVNIDERSVAPRSLLPVIDMDPAVYRIKGSGPDGEAFQADSAGGGSDFHDLAPGVWLISVSAINLDGDEIGYGEKAVLVEKAKFVAVTIKVVPFSGTGSLSLSVSWPAEAVSGAGVSASLTGAGGAAVPLEFEIGAGSASYYGAAIDSGYYTLILQLLEEGSVVAGVVETVRIVKDALTEGVFNFADLNYPTGDVSIDITVDLDVPLEVAITGVPAVLPYGTAINASSAVSNAGGSDLVYSWYLNGSPVAGSGTVSFGADLWRGFYRLDVVVFTADGLRSGSASYSFTVE